MLIVEILKNIYTPDRRILWSLIGVLFFVLLFYGYFVNATIINIVGRQNTLQEVNALESLIGDLESQYSNLRNVLTHDYASSLGFNEPDDQIFVSQKQLVQGSLFVQEQSD